jgi:hypothetical protein
MVERDSLRVGLLWLRSVPYAKTPFGMREIAFGMREIAVWLARWYALRGGRPPVRSAYQIPRVFQGIVQADGVWFARWVAPAKLAGSADKCQPTTDNSPQIPAHRFRLFQYRRTHQGRTSRMRLWDRAAAHSFKSASPSEKASMGVGGVSSHRFSILSRVS